MLIKIKVSPGASKQKFGEWFVDEKNERVLKVFISAPPEDGKGNKAVIELFAKELGLKKSDIEIVSGQTSRVKLIKIPDNILQIDKQLLLM
jgi:uncharacterized protein (TIGR00251 family)